MHIHALHTTQILTHRCTLSMLIYRFFFIVQTLVKKLEYHFLKRTGAINYQVNHLYTVAKNCNLITFISLNNNFFFWRTTISAVYLLKAKDKEAGQVINKRCIQIAFATIPLCVLRRN